MTAYTVRPLRAPSWLAGISIFGLIAGASHAYAETAETAAAGGLDQLGEIVVTASKRETDVQKTPLAVTALSASVLQQTHVTDALGLNGLVPSLVISTSESFQRSVAIRGIGFNVPQNDSAQPSVSYHVDGVYIANPIALNTNFLDVGHVEVVRGPQGTVYGQNSTGGTVNVISNLPALGRVSGSGKLDLGNFDLVQAESAINLPFGETFAVRAAGQMVSRDGFAKATRVPGTNGSFDLSDENSYHLRLTGLWQPSDRFSLMLRAEYAQANNHNSQGKNIDDPDPDPWRQSSDWPGKTRYRNEIYTGTLTYDLGFATLKAFGSHQMVSHKGSYNQDGLDLPLAIATYGIPGFSSVHDLQYYKRKSKANTGEIDLASPAGQTFEWIVGAFYLQSKNNVGYDQYAVDSYPVTGDPTSLLNQLNPPVTDPNALGTAGPNGFYYPYFYSIAQLKRESYSLYGQATYHLSDRLRATGGLRYTRDHNTTDICNYVCAASIFAERTDKALTGKIGAEYDLAAKTMLYASVSTGFKPGGGNIAEAPIIIGVTFKPERVTAYELGMKSSLLDNRVRFNVAGFYYDYKDLQFQAEDAVAYQGGVDNIPKSHVYGFEAETSILLPADLRFDGNLTLAGSKITSHYDVLDNVRGYAIDKAIFAQNLNGLNCVFAECRDADIAARTAAFFDVYGNRMPNLPTVAATGTLTHTLRFADGGVLTSSIQGQYRSRYINAVYGDLVLNGRHIYRSPSYTLWNLFLGYELPDRNWRVSFVIKNLANSGEVLGQFTNQFGGEITRQYAPPRQFIGSVSYSF